MTARPAVLVLADGSLFEGEAIGHLPDGGVVTGEVVFNTVMTGYQEVITDPSYAGQIVTFTYPHIGNYGIAAADSQAPVPHCRGVVIRDPARITSSWRADEDLQSFLVRHRIGGIGGVDTRRLTRLVRDLGAVPGAFGATDETVVRAAAARAVGTDGVDLVATVTCAEPYRVAGDPRRRVVAYDFGVKASILANLARIADVEVVPASTPASDVLAREPDGVFLSNGPGDPAAVAGARRAVGELVGEVPIFGICLGNQILALALGASTFKLPFGHHGGNHPIGQVDGGAVQITSENHNYAVAEHTLVDAEVTHRNLNDGVVEGFRCRSVPAFSVQYHPEASPGPHDSIHHFTEFAELIDRCKT